jgi:hypothetical protein
MAAGMNKSFKFNAYSFERKNKLQNWLIEYVGTYMKRCHEQISNVSRWYLVAGGGVGALGKVGLDKADFG